MPALAHRRATIAVALLLIVLSAAQVHAQGKTFDVVSIRQNTSQEEQGGPSSFSPAPDGFHVTRTPLLLILLTAYTSTDGGLFMNRIENLPNWAKSDNYNIDARISDADRSAWQDPKNQPAMLQHLLEAMLADRFKLAVHRGVTEKPVYELVLLKGGPKFQESKPNESRPSGLTLPGGGVIGPQQKPGGVEGRRLYNFSMGMLAAVLSDKSSDRPVVDKTGLSGRYTFDFPEARSMGAPSASSNGDDPKPAMEDVLKGLGLKLEPAKEPVETLVIDHLERPTEN